MRDAMDDADHYVCTILPHGGRVQVGPMSLSAARGVAMHLKAKSSSLCYATWVDWRRLDQYPLMSRETHRAEVAPASVRQPTLPLGQFSDSILIAELKTRGYLVPKKDYVRDLTCQDVYVVHEYEAMARNPTWLHQAHRALGRRMADLLLRDKAIEIFTVDGNPGEVSLHMRAVVVAPEPHHA